MKTLLGILASALLAATTWVAAPAAAAPISSSVGLQNAVESPVQTVRGGWRGGGYRGGYRGYRGYGFYGGLGTGLIVGGALASPYYYGNPYGYAPYGGYPYTAAPYAGGDAVAYCSQRFRSYDPGSGTYLGYDGLRHPCP